MPFTPEQIEQFRVLGRRPAPMPPCEGSQQPPQTVRVDRILGRLWGQCGSCERIMKPTTKGGLLRTHQPRNRSTRSLDQTRDILWDAAEQR